MNCKDKEYARLHRYIREIKPKPELCEICKEKKRLTLSSNNHTYTRNPDDYRYLCLKCHLIVDGNPMHRPETVKKISVPMPVLYKKTASLAIPESFFRFLLSKAGTKIIR